MDVAGRSKLVRIERFASAARVVSQNLVDQTLELFPVLGGGLRPANVLFQFREEESGDLILLGRRDGSQALDRLFPEACHGEDYTTAARIFSGLTRHFRQDNRILPSRRVLAGRGRVRGSWLFENRPLTPTLSPEYGGEGEERIECGCPAIFELTACKLEICARAIDNSRYNPTRPFFGEIDL